MIEIAVDKEKENLRLVIDGHVDDDPTSVLPVGLSGPGGGVGLWISTRSDNTIDRLLQHSFADFPEEPWTLQLRWYHEVTRRMAVIDNVIFNPITIYRTANDHLYLGF